MSHKCDISLLSVLGGCAVVVASLQYYCGMVVLSLCCAIAAAARSAWRASTFLRCGVDILNGHDARIIISSPLRCAL